MKDCINYSSVSNKNIESNHIVLKGLHGEGFLSSVEDLQNGRYALLKKLGEGGKGVVYKARDTTLNRIVAIKMLKSAVASEDAYSRFMTEAHAVAKLNHPNIVTIHDIGKEDGKQFFVLEFVDGESLRDLMQTYPEGKCDIQTVLRIGMDVCSALQYAHSEKVLHRDIKPENVMITRDGAAKLMDFGLAKMIGQPSVTQEGVIVGTVAYVAPEAALGKGVDSRSDLYSFGAVLYEALSGKPPFPGDNPIKVIFGHIHDHPTPLSKLNLKIPQAIVDCVMRLLEKDPEKRYQSAEDLLKALRGISEQFLRETLVPAHNASLVVPSPRPIAAREIQLIDRVEEMGVLREAVDKTAHGEGGVVFLHGEAGIGKTRLTRELRAYARLRGLQVLYGRCPALFRMDGVPPYVLWGEVIRDYLETCSPEHLYKVIGFYPSEVSKLVPELRQKLGAIPQSLPISPEHEQNRLFEAVSQFIINISRESPLLVVLDDLQWTDPSSLLLLHYIARGAYRTPLLLLGAYRSTDIDSKHPLTPILTELNRERLLQSVQLKRMSLDEISEMIKRIIEQDDVPSEFCKLVYQKTRGNPFFAEEVVKSLKEEEVIYREEDKWKLKEIAEIKFPETIKSVVKARFSRLDNECQNVLSLASFIGNDFGSQALGEVTGIEETKLLELMDELIKTGLIKHRVVRGEDLCSFADVIVRDVVYEEAGPFRRKKLHDTVGRALERVYAKKIDEHFGELASHFLESGDKDKALDYFLKAGEKAAKVYANSEATSYLQSALRLLEEKDELREKGRVLESLGDIKRLIGEYDNCTKYWNEALLLWNQLNEKANVSRLHRKMANVLWESLGDSDKAGEHHTKALKALETEPESVELASLYQDMAAMISMEITGDMAEARSWAEKALELAKRLNAHEVIASSYAWLGEILGRLGDLKRFRECLQKALKIALDNGYIKTALLAYNDLGALLSRWIEPETGFDYYNKGFELAKKAGDIFQISWISRALSYSYISMGDMKKAMPLAEESLELNRKTGDMIQLPMSLSALGFAYQVLGEWEKSERYFEEAVNISQRIGDYQTVGGTYLQIAFFHVAKEEYFKARGFVEKAYEISEKHGAKWDQMWSATLLIRTYIGLGEVEKAKNLIDNVDKFALEIKDSELIAYTDVLRGLLFSVQKKWEESIKYFETGLQEYEDMNSRRWNVYFFAKMVLCEYAGVHLERNQEGDREKAHNLLNQAMEMFQKIGAKKDIEKIIAKKKLLTA
jgi:tetratricopeptide (TPR) repeat protein/tRNA A-37 threonylcarbamoyl transferase component Bud32